MKQISIDIVDTQVDQGVDSNNDKDSKPNKNQKSDEEMGDEFDFPLFSAVASSSVNDDETEDRGRSKTHTMKVSLREPSIETFKNVRPDSYYFASYSDDDKSKFLVAAVSAEDVYTQGVSLGSMATSLPWKCLDLKEHNMEVEREQRRLKKQKRPGKKKREQKIAGKERNSEREKKKRLLEKQMEARMLKKIFHKRGGKKHKKKIDERNSSAEKAQPPKYRTE